MILRSVALVATASALQRLPAPLARRRGLNGKTIRRVLDVPVDAENSVSELAELIADLGAADLNARPPAPRDVLSNLEELRSFKFFSLYSIDMLANCAYIGGAVDECEFDAARRTCIGGICPEDDENGWRAVFDRSISGMHASIACHVVDDFSEDDDECLAEFRRRLQPEAHPERLRNLNFAFSLPALSKMAPLLREGAVMATECVLATDDESGDEFADDGHLADAPASRAMLAMDCVQCGACRLHGKVAWLGIATAMRIIYGDTSSKPLARVEVAGLITTLA
ncbi:hypothetical protein JL720_6762 [Aureococcus anophagefferens]|nr:hypothetical protein JL720_6762 [Aureococcus anophagefferens]